jgi:hypothetical protein
MLAQFSGCISTTNAHSEAGQMAVCCQNLTLGVLNSCSALSMLVGALFKKFAFFLNTVVYKTVKTMKLGIKLNEIKLNQIKLNQIKACNSHNLI